MLYSNNLKSVFFVIYTFFSFSSYVLCQTNNLPSVDAVIYSIPCLEWRNLHDYTGSWCESLIEDIKGLTSYCEDNFGLRHFSLISHIANWPFYKPPNNSFTFLLLNDNETIGDGLFNTVSG